MSFVIKLLGTEKTDFTLNNGNYTDENPDKKLVELLKEATEYFAHRDFDKYMPSAVKKYAEKFGVSFWPELDNDMVIWWLIDNSKPVEKETPITDPKLDKLRNRKIKSVTQYLDAL